MDNESSFVLSTRTPHAKGAHTLNQALRARGLASGAIAVTSIGLGAGEITPQMKPPPPTVVVSRAHGAGSGGIAAVVRGIPPRGNVRMELEGATDAHGRALPWIHLHRSNDGWRGVLPQPALIGSYPVVVASGSRRYRRAGWMFLAYPSTAVLGRTFATPGDAARSWVERLPGDQVVVAMRSWRPTALDRRDRRFNELLVIAYAPRGDSRVNDRLGVFLTIARRRLHGRWWLFQVSVTPYGRRRS